MKKNNGIKLLCLIMCLGYLAGCNNQNQTLPIVENEVNEEYNTALKLVQDFAKEEDQNLSRNKNENIKIITAEKSSIILNNNLSRSSKKGDKIDLYTFSFKKNGNIGFAIATGDERVAQVVSYVEKGTLADTVNIPEMTIMLHQIPVGLENDLQIFYEEQQLSISRIPSDWNLVKTGPLVKTTWDVGEPYNNNYDIGGCNTTSNYKYKASTTAVAFAQAMITNKKRPSGFPAHYILSEWTREPKIDAKYNIYAPQVAEFIRFLEPASATFGCDISIAQVNPVMTVLTYYGYQQNVSCGTSVNVQYERIARNVQDGYCAVFGGTTRTDNPNYYGWVVDGFQGYLSPDKKQCRLVMVHCAYSRGGQGNGWYKSAFDKSATGGKEDPNVKGQYIYFDPF